MLGLRNNRATSPPFGSTPFWWRAVRDSASQVYLRRSVSPMSDNRGLHKEQKTVTRGGVTFQQSYWMKGATVPSAPIVPTATTAANETQARGGFPIEGAYDIAVRKFRDYKAGLGAPSTVRAAVGRVEGDLTPEAVDNLVSAVRDWKPGMCADGRYSRDSMFGGLAFQDSVKILTHESGLQEYRVRVYDTGTVIVGTGDHGPTFEFAHRYNETEPSWGMTEPGRPEVPCRHVPQAVETAAREGQARARVAADFRQSEARFRALELLGQSRDVGSPERRRALVGEAITLLDAR